MTGWDEHGHAVMTGLPIDQHLGHGDLQDGENCGYTPFAALSTMRIDQAQGGDEAQFRAGRIVLTDGTVLQRGGTLNCVWAVTRLPSYTEAEVDALAAVLFEARDRGITHGHFTLARWVLDRWAVQREREAHERGVAEGRRQATEGWDREWAVQVAPDARRLCDDEEDAREWAELPGWGDVVSRLVGPWEPTEQPAAPSHGPGAPRHGYDGTCGEDCDNRTCPLGANHDPCTAACVEQAKDSDR